MELRRAAGLVKVICRTADSRPGGKGQKSGKPKKKDGLLASFGDWFGSINMICMTETFPVASRYRYIPNNLGRKCFR